MDIEKLIERLKHDYHGYSTVENNPEETFHDMVECLTALSTLQAENADLRAELERMKKIMRKDGIMVIPSKYPGGPAEWNIPKPRGQKED